MFAMITERVRQASEGRDAGWSLGWSTSTQPQARTSESDLGGLLPLHQLVRWGVAAMVPRTGCCNFLRALCVTGLLCVRPTRGQGCVGTLAGITLHPPSDGASVFGADLSGLYTAAVNPIQPCNLYLTTSDRVLLAGCDKTISHFAGGASASADDVLQYPAVSINHAGDTIVADLVAIRKLNTQTGLLQVIAGNTSAGPGWSPDGTLGLSASLSAYCVHVAPNGDIYYCESANQVRVLRMSGQESGRIFTVAGNGAQLSASDGALATNTGLARASDAYCDNNGDVLIAENDPAYPRILRVSASDGRIRTVAGTLVAEWEDYFVDGANALTTPLGVVNSVCSVSERVYFSDGWRVAFVSSGLLRVLSGQVPRSASPSFDGISAVAASYHGIQLIRLGAKDTELIVPSGSDATVYRIDLLESRVFVEAGFRTSSAVTPGSSDGVLAPKMRLNTPSDAIFDPLSGDVFIANSGGNVVVRVFAQSGTIKVVAGNGEPGAIHNISVPDATTVSLRRPWGLLLDGRGGLVFSDRYNCLVYRLDIQARSLCVT
jgi:hypothetical protein